MDNNEIEGKTIFHEIISINYRIPRNNPPPGLIPPPKISDSKFKNCPRIIPPPEKNRIFSTRGESKQQI